MDIYQRDTGPESQSTSANIGIGWRLATMGRTKEARQLLQELSSLPDNQRFSPYGLAVISAAVGDFAQAFDYLTT